MKSSEQTNPLSIVMLVASLPPLPAGGAEMQALMLGKTLMESGHEVIFITPGKGKVKGVSINEGMQVYRPHSFVNICFDWLAGIKKKNTRQVLKIEYNDNEETTNIIATKVGWPTILYYNIFFWQCLWLLWPKRKKIDILHAHTMEWSAIVAARLGKVLKKPVVIKDSTMNGFQSLGRYPNGKRLQQMVIANACFVAMTKIIGENLMRAGIPAPKITYIPNGLMIQDVPARKAKSDRNVLFIGNLYQQPAKGIDILLKAWKIVTEQFPGVMLLIIGDGDRKMYEDYARQSGIDGAVKLLGRRSDIRDYLLAASVFVLPSRREGMSNALMEAMLFELPCVATDISGNNDLIQNGVNGLIVPPADVQALAEGICYMLRVQQEASAMGKKARETIIKEYDIRLIAQRYLRLYKTLIGS